MIMKQTMTVCRCNYENVCKNDGKNKDVREFCVRCTRYIPHETHSKENRGIPNFMRDYSLTTGHV